MSQRFPAISAVWFRCTLGSSCLPARGTRESGWGLALILLILTAVTAPLGAQSRSDLQVAARVVETQPSRLALAQGLAAARFARASVVQSLAAVQVEPNYRKSERPTAARRPRTVVTISFLRN